MSIINSQPLIGASGNQGVAGYNLTKSLRFRGSAGAYLNRTPASAGDRQKFTFSFWCKRGTLGSAQRVIQSRDDATANGNNFTVQFTAADTLFIDNYANAYLLQLYTSQVFRDPSAWYHITIAIDTTQATASNRAKLYVNGNQVTAFGTTAYPSQNTNLNWNVSGQPCNIARYSDATGNSLYFYDGYLTEVNFIDGQALTPSSFGETNSTTGVWKPKAYTGTYGTNGFYLPFTDVATTSGSNAGLGKDFSGNGNYWNTNNISVTSGATYDSMTDVPTLTSATQANYAVLNPLNTSATIADGNLQWSNNANNGSASTIAPNTGKWYAEFTFSAINSSVATFGVSNLLTSNAFNGATQTWQLGYSSAGKLENAGSQTTVATYTTGDVVAVAFDCPTGAATFYKNNTSVGTITNASFANVPVILGLGSGGSPSGTSTGVANFGQRPFAFSPPSGYVALNTYNLP